MRAVERIKRGTEEYIYRGPKVPRSTHNVNEKEHVGQIAIMRSMQDRRIVVSANRWGKTACGMQEILHCARGKHPERPVNPEPHQFWVCCPNFNAYKRIHKPAFDEWCPKSWMAGRFNNNERFVDIERADGGICRIWFLSYDQNPQAWTGAEVDGVWMDEEPPREHYKEAMARIASAAPAHELSRGGFMLMTFTPVKGIGWWYENIWKPAREHHEKVAQNEGIPIDQCQPVHLGPLPWWTHQAALAVRDEERDDDHEVGEVLVPHLSHEQIVSFASNYPDIQDRLIRIFGEIRGRQGLIYKQFEKDIHVIDPFGIPVEYDIWGAVDPGFHGFGVVFGAISPEERIYVVDEMFSQGEGIEQRFTAIADKVRKLRDPEEWPGKEAVVTFFVDTADPQMILELNIQSQEYIEKQEKAKAGDGADEVIVKLAFASLDQGFKAIKAGFLRVQTLLQPSQDRGTPAVVTRKRPDNGEPDLYFFSSLYSEWQGEEYFFKRSRVVWELEAYSWKPPPRDHVLDIDEPDKYSAHGGHMMDALRYLIMARLGPLPEEQRDLIPAKMAEDKMSDRQWLVWKRFREDIQARQDAYAREQNERYW